MPAYSLSNMNVDGLHALHILANKFGIIPSLHQNPDEPFKGPRFSDQLRGAAYIVFFVCVNMYSLYGKGFVFGKDVNKAVLGTYTLTEMIGTVINILCIVKLNLRYGNKLQAFLGKLQHLERFILRKEDVPNEKRKFLIEFVATTVLGIVFTFTSFYVYFTQLGWDVYKYFALREIQIIHVLSLLEMMTRYPKLIALRMKELNGQLKISVFQGRIGLTPSIGALKSFNEAYPIKTIAEAYTTVVELIQEYNKLFGSLCLFFCSNIVVNLLVPINMALLFMQGTPIHSEQDFGPSFIVLCVFWVVFPCIFGMKLLAISDQVKNEVDKVPYMCYSLMQTLGDGEFKLKNELEQYATQADRMKAKVTAAGYFDIDLGLTLPILGSVFTYIIVLLQFHNI